MAIRRSLRNTFVAAAAGVAAPLLISSAAHAEVAAPTISPNPTSQDGEVTISGADCVDADGPGVVSLSIVHADGQEDVLDPSTADDDGSWTYVAAPKTGSVDPGNYTVKASCDLYTGSFDYPSANLTVNAVFQGAPTISADDVTLVNGQKVTVSVRGFNGGEDLDVTLHSDPIKLGTMRTDATGAATGTFTIPANVPAGQHTIVVSNAAGQKVQITVTISSATSTVSGSTTVSGSSTVAGKRGPVLADTGVETAPYAAAAAGLLLAGAGALALGRRKQA